MRRISGAGDVQPAVQALQAGGLICYPTETFYALGADPWNESACSRLRELKQRPEEKDFPLIAANVDMVAQFCDISDSRFPVLAQRFWPGPLTLVLRARHGPKSFAVRVSPHPVAARLSLQSGGPLISTSANLSGDPPVTDPGMLSPRLHDGIDVLVDGGICPGGSPSTIVSLLTRPASILREGAVPSARILAAL
ncbi:MAG TPA: L-threonylcarbamoyladenylate synthase [Acidobacteriota bacterium]|nr:L-threonylcarbamoyladenylate synthase [Acidobacteriota bacterium]